MAVPAVTPAYIRANYTQYKDFLFRFLYGTGDDYYDCKYEPEGWATQNIKFTRNRKNVGLVRTFAENLEFVKEDSDFLMNFMNTYRHNLVLNLEIWQLDNTTLTYSMYYKGVVDFTKWEFKNYKFKIELKDNLVQALIDNNGGNEYSIPAIDYLSYLKWFTYSGIKIFETCKFVRSTTGLKIERIYQTPGINADTFINLSQTSIVNSDTKITEFSTIESEIIEYQGNPTQATSSIISIKKNGTLFINLVYHFAIYDTDQIGVGTLPTSYQLIFNDGNCDSGSWHQTIGSGSLTFDSNGHAVFDVYANYSFAVTAGQEIYLMLVLRRCVGSTGYVNRELTIYHNIGMPQIDNSFVCSFKETVVPVETQMIRLNDLLQLSLDKATNGIATYVNNSSADLLKCFMINGNFLRGLYKYNFNVKLNDLLSLICNKFGVGYEISGDVLIFYDIPEFFDNTQVGYTFIEPANFEILSNTDLMYSTIKSGDKPFDSEYFSGKFSVHEETTFKTLYDSSSNEQNLMCEISTNPFEIDDSARKALEPIDFTDFAGDYQVFCIWGILHNVIYEIDRNGIDQESMPPDYYYPDTIFNLYFSPVRIIERNLMPIHQTLFNNTDKIKALKRTKYEGFYSAMGGENTKYEFRDFMISPRCGATTEPYLTDDNFKIEPQFYSFTVPTGTMALADILANAKKMVKVTNDGLDYYGFIDDFGVNPLTNEPNTMRLIKAHIDE